jgi:hypothetical protein
MRDVCGFGWPARITGRPVFAIYVKDDLECGRHVRQDHDYATADVPRATAGPAFRLQIGNPSAQSVVFVFEPCIGDPQFVGELVQPVGRLFQNDDVMVFACESLSESHHTLISVLLPRIGFVFLRVAAIRSFSLPLIIVVRHDAPLLRMAGVPTWLPPMANSANHSGGRKALEKSVRLAASYGSWM